MSIPCAKTPSRVKTNHKSQSHLSTEIDIQTLVNQAAKIIPPVWPLKTFIACNPLQGFESQPFDTALAEAATLSEQDALHFNEINRESIKWCGVFFNEGPRIIDLPGFEKGFYGVFKELSLYDTLLHCGSKPAIKWLKQLPKTAEEAISLCFKTLQIADKDRIPFLKKSMAQLPGWTGYIKWRTEWQNTSNRLEKYSNLLVEFIAIRLIITVRFYPNFNLIKSPSYINQAYKPILKNIKKHEEEYTSKLLPSLLANAKNVLKSPKKLPCVQLVFCIDVRSEPFRRQLELQGPYETFGFAGFFGLPVRLHDFNSGKITDACPVLLKPKHDIYDCPEPDHVCVEKKHQRGKTILNSLASIYQQLKYNIATPFALVETLGAWCGVLMLSKTFKPSTTLSIINKWITAIKPAVTTIPSIDASIIDSTKGISSTDQALYAENVLRIMGLTDSFANIVVLCGHGSSTQNNPYASGLDCGACGGNHGGGNAKILAAILNQPSVRASLSNQGIHIPKDTLFLAAEHNTTTDDVIIFDQEKARLLHEKDMEQLQYHLTAAKQKNTASRVNDFDTHGQSCATKETMRRSQDWSEVRPEWGLARNAAFIIGPRSLTKPMNLEGRCFLHSYDWTKDESLSSLETILTAPLIVAEWINTQYLFSTINNVLYGSGSKVTHNVTGKIGIMQGNSSDLMHGLPLQSVNACDTQNHHIPQRLLAVIYAPRENVTTIINRQGILKTLFFNEWINVLVIEPSENNAYMLQTSGEWCLLENVTIPK